MNATILRPGILLALKSSVHGGVRYQRTDLEQTETTARWETTRFTTDPDEHRRAEEARQQATALIRAACANTSFGLLCPPDREPSLDEAIAAARAIAQTHNDTSTHTYVALYLLKGRVSATDEEAVRSISNELASLLSLMNTAIDRLDVDAIRDAAQKARDTAKLLGDETSSLVTNAIQAARNAARQITRRITKNGEAAAAVLASLRREAISSARFTFLDLATQPDSNESALPSIERQRFADLDLSTSPRN